MEKFIIKSRSKKEPNWSGKEFSSNPAKIYSSFQDAVDALNGYWFNDFFHQLMGTVPDNRTVLIIPITEEKKQELLTAGAIRW